MAAAALSFSPTFSSDHTKPYQRLPFLLSPTYQKHPFLSFHRPHRFIIKSSSSHSSSSSSSSSPVSSSTATTEEIPISSSISTYDYLEESFKTGRFLSNEELEKLKTLQDFSFIQELGSGSLLIRVMRSEEMDMTVNLLAESFGESMLLPKGYHSLLGYLVKQYLMERREVLPYAVTLLGFYRWKGGGDDGYGEELTEEKEKEVLAGTVEVCFDKRGANASPPTPTPPKSSPYICNMTVKKQLRRLGIGWNLLKASEELVSQMSSTREVYLHCRMIDSAPFNMYTKAGYKIVGTDSVLVLLMLQRRKHLMCKKLPTLNCPLEHNISGSDTESASQLDTEKS